MSPSMQDTIRVGVVVAILHIFSHLVRYNTKQCLTFQIMNFLYVTLLTPGFLKWLQAFCKICGPQP